MSLSLKEIYDLMCPECKEKLKQAVKEKLQDDLVKRILEGAEDDKAIRPT